jgi:hypothetical protein
MVEKVRPAAPYLSVGARGIKRARRHVCPIKAQLVDGASAPCHFIGRVLDSLATDRKRPEKSP